MRRWWCGWLGVVCALVAAGAASASPSAAIEHAARAEAEVAREPIAPFAPPAAFAIVDKRAAQIAVYDAAGRLAGVAPALIGLAPGDRSYPDAVAKLLQGRLPLEERTTPAGRYASMPNVNLKGERIVWIDYANALAIHRLRPAAPSERRAQRLASPTPDDNRITLGCVVVDPAFFDEVVLPLLGRSRGVVVVLQDDLPPDP